MQLAQVGSKKKKKHCLLQRPSVCLIQIYSWKTVLCILSTLVVPDVIRPEAETNENCFENFLLPIFDEAIGLTGDALLKLLTGGYMNTIYKCWSNSSLEESGSSESVIVRINGTNLESKLVVRSRELRNIKLLNSYGIGNKLLATFENGIVYTYFEGHSLDRIISDWNIIR